ncbi:AMP-binding protein [Micromonospora sp. RL09-050-HVF-A]|uniref:AMP-binding protein n=1 Tax=Micromonospora sp. RL09-050-HVF-A TaxID=1703433 RepID=UPI0027E2931C|nr:AMP-binding protein [Micromonospora sp. RL09-050-HVF-A]
MSAGNLAGILEGRCADRADLPGLYGEDGGSWTFDQIDLLAGGVAAALRAEGVGPGDRVACYLTNGPEIVFLLFGAWKIGAVPVTVSSLYNAAELAESVAKTAPRLLLVDDRRPDVVAAFLATRAAAGDATRAAPGTTAPGRVTSPQGSRCAPSRRRWPGCRRCRGGGRCGSPASRSGRRPRRASCSPAARPGDRRRSVSPTAGRGSR